MHVTVTCKAASIGNIEREMRVAMVGSGLSGLVAAHELARSGGVRVTVYEKEDHLGGAKTVAVDGGAEEGRVLVDLGPVVFNPVTSPNLMEWFERLGVEMCTSDMSFSASMRLNKSSESFEWGSRSGMSGVLAQKSNLLSPRFWLVVHEIFKFKNHALKYLEDHRSGPNRNETLGQFILSHRYSQLFQDAYLIPMCACIWPSPSHEILGFPALFVLSFFRDNQLLEILSGSKWLTVKGGSGSYVNKIREELESNGCQIKIGCEVNSISKSNDGYQILEVDGSVETYDRIIIGINAHDALKVLGAEATNEELKNLGAFHFIRSIAYLHSDESLMPRNSSAWSARNFLGTTSSGVCVTSWLNILENIESAGPLLVTLNPPRVPNHVLLKCHISHPIPSIAAAKANLQLNSIQGKRGIWFCGSYQGYGYHEDSVKAGKAAALGLLGRKCDLLSNPKPMVSSWTEAGARLLVARSLDQYITIGNFCILEEGGTTFSFGKACEKCHVKSAIRVHDPQFYWKAATEGDLGFASAYINGQISFVDHRKGLVNLVRIILANRGEFKRLSSTASGNTRKAWWSPLLGITGVSFAKYFLRHALRKNSVSKARKNISEHYDLSNDFFALYLDPSMTYSSGIFKVAEESLETAQLRKLDSLINKAKVEPGHHVLDIGCGWGTLAIRLVKQTGCKYTGITLSEEQLKYAKRKVKESGLEDRITLLLCDYRQLPAGDKFDRIISCEMIEHVGHEYMDDFFGCCEYHLAEHGLLVLQSIALPEELYDKMRMRPEFLKTYIFPGGCLPSLGRIVSAMSNASRLNIQHLENIGDHYYTTLMNWRDNFVANREKASALGFDDKFIRTWEYYLSYAAALFKSRTAIDYQIVFARPGDSKLPSYVAIA
ncbi:uncharacterized protein [Zea mays]|uniref:Cyclopropane-fatty-acyl-phospholipid synthase n=4 Tax=Zea mays TaxID=4577 RepID=A0A1D6PN79_MAIZE|nr:uncharacterized protein LOC103652693 [Zea mays]AQK48315.1 Cyclopropane-fatty-acyl-phospholipid synthase [Zea mays]|eukprot:XP_008677860.1 uncharacterized protein LOC103652693 isoform X1 [Zea mays]